MNVNKYISIGHSYREQEENEAAEHILSSVDMSGTTIP